MKVFCYYCSGVDALDRILIEGARKCAAEEYEVKNGNLMHVVKKLRSAY